MNELLKKIPDILSSKVSIYIYLFLFFYLVVFPGVGVIIPTLNAFLPTGMVQLILGNYTNVLSALGASIAAGTSVQSHEKLKNYQQKHESLESKIDALHEKVDILQGTTK